MLYLRVSRKSSDSFTSAAAVTTCLEQVKQDNKILIQPISTTVAPGVRHSLKQTYEQAIRCPLEQTKPVTLFSALELEQQLGEGEVGRAVEGRTGTAAAYSHEH